MNEKELEKARKSGNASNRPPYWTVFKRAFPQLFNVFFIFFITLSLFPTIQSSECRSDIFQLLRLLLMRIQINITNFIITDIKRVDESFFVPQELYTEVLCFLTFNVCAMLGSLATSFVQWVRTHICVDLCRYLSACISRFNNLFMPIVFEFLAKKRVSSVSGVASDSICPIVFGMQLWSGATQWGGGYFCEWLDLLGNQHCNGIHFWISEVIENENVECPIGLSLLICFNISFDFRSEQFAWNDVRTTNSSTATRTNGRHVCRRHVNHWNFCRLLNRQRTSIYIHRSVLVTFVFLCRFKRHTHSTIC